MPSLDIQRRFAFLADNRELLLQALVAYGDAPAALLPPEELLTGRIQPTSIVTRSEELQVALATGMEGARKLRSGLNPQALSPSELTGAEAIVLLVSRPALLITNGTFLNVPDPWAVLHEHRRTIESNIAGVGRIEVEGHPELDWVGTGFLVADDIVMTNRHVVTEFARLVRNRWTIAESISASIDLFAEKTSVTENRFPITEIIAVHDEHDLALLRLGQAANPSAPKPAPLRFATSIGLDPGREVYVIGYPSMDGRRNDPMEMQRIFQRIYDVKRLQPGTVMSKERSRTVFHHDCSTLGGNSGSPVIALDTHLVIGLHFGGRYLSGNSAVDLPSIQFDPVLTTHMLPFV